MKDDCVVNADDILTIRTSVLLDQMTSLTAEKMADVESAVRFALDLR